MLPATDPTVANAAAYAGAFAAAYLSWSEEDPQRRAAALRSYLEDPEMVARLGWDAPQQPGWDGRGCRSADIVLLGAVDVRDHPPAVVVDVRVRYTPFQRVDHTDDDQSHTETPAPTNALDGALLAAAPAPPRPDWRALGARWTRLAVPVVQVEGRFLIDIEKVHD